MKYLAAVDLGTTSIEVHILDEAGIVCYKDGFLNPLKKFGSDVISRITNSTKGNNLQLMCDLLRKNILNSISASLTKLSGFDLAESKKTDLASFIDKICISGNTVMASIFLELNIESLGVSPFTMTFKENVILNLEGIKTIVLSGASAFIGGDALAGAASLEMRDGDILMDLGTNGEIIVKNKEKYYAASAACGPAFENCTRSKGIYGNVTISDISKSIKLNKTARDCSKYEEKFSYEVLHQVMLAGSALYSTLKLLLEKADLSYDNIGRFFISGGFGFFMNLSDAVNIGLVPQNLLQSAIISVNTSIEGARSILLSEKALDKFEKIKNNIKVFQFGGDEQYNDLFINSLGFYKRNIK